MKAEKIGNELSRLVNEISRKYRNRKDTPSPLEITSLAKLADSYRDILLVENPSKSARDPGRGQVGGYEALVRMHAEAEAERRRKLGEDDDDAGDPEESEDNEG